MFKLRRKYIDPANQQLFVNFKYKGGTDSITYQHIWGPFAQYLLNFIPLWVAPNLITLSSLILMTITHLLFMYCGSNDNGVPIWKLIMMAVALLIYQNLDNLDGKQARRTRSGSPLGMLFDHGVDSLCAFLITLQFLEIIRIKDFNFIILIVFLFVMGIFFSALWNQYSTGVFKLGRVNPVDEGIPGLALAILGFIFIETEIFERHNFVGPLNLQIMGFFGVLLVLILVSMNKNIFANATRQKGDVLQTLSLLLITGLVLFLVHYVDSQTYYKRSGLQVYYSLLFFWSRNMIQIQLYYISQQTFKVYNRGTTIFMITLVGYLIYGKYLEQIGISVQLYFWLVLLINAIIFFQFVLSVFKQSSQLLGINVLSIKTKQN